MEPIKLETAQEVIHKVRDVLQSWPLYRQLRYTGFTGMGLREYPWLNLPSPISFFCPRCRKSQLWDVGKSEGSFYHVQNPMYVCRNCKDQSIRFSVEWVQARNADEASTFVKFGQLPPIEEHVIPELRRRLSQPDEQDLNFYRKAIRCRNYDFGLAALSYLRRVLENRINDLLDLIVEMGQEHDFTTELKRELQDLKASKSFSDKVSLGVKILPESLKPSGNNPMDLLHDLASEGIHSLSEDECLELFDRCRVVFEYLFRELEVRKADAEKYLEGIKALAEKRAQRSSRGEKGN